METKIKMKTLKSKISMFSMKSGFKQPAAEGDPEREGLLCKNEDGDVAFKTGDEGEPSYPG